jgi:hypothetical protein
MFPLEAKFKNHMEVRAGEAKNGVFVPREVFDLFKPMLVGEIFVLFALRHTPPLRAVVSGCPGMLTLVYLFVARLKLPRG